MLSSHDIQVSMVTNGFLLTEDKASVLLKSGVSRVQISVDGATKISHEYMRQMPNSFEKALNALREPLKTSVFRGNFENAML